MKKFLLFFLFILLLSCDKDSNYIESLKLIKFDKPIKVSDVTTKEDSVKGGLYTKEDIFLQEIIYNCIAFTVLEDVNYNDMNTYFYNEKDYVNRYIDILEDISKKARWEISDISKNNKVINVFYDDYIAKLFFSVEGKLVNVDLSDLSVYSPKSLYTYNFDEDFSTEYKKLSYAQAGSRVIGGTQRNVKKEIKEKVVNNEEVNLEEIYNTKDTSKLSKLNEIELKILQNYPFAKDGYVFETPELKEYFENQSWYEPSTTLSNDQINKKNKKDEWFLYIKKYMEFSSYDK